MLNINDKLGMAHKQFDDLTFLNKRLRDYVETKGN